MDPAAIAASLDLAPHFTDYLASLGWLPVAASRTDWSATRGNCDDQLRSTGNFR